MRRYLPMLAALLVTAGMVSGCSGGGSSSKIRVGTVSRADVAEVVQASATITARATATLRAPSDGTVARLYVTDGDTVHKGQLLARLDSGAARDQLRQAKQADAAIGSGSVAIPAGLGFSGLQAQTDRTAKRGFAAARKAAAKITDLKVRAQVLAQIAQAEGQYAAAAAAAQTAVVRLNSGLGSVSAAMSSIAGAQRVQTRAAVQQAQRVVDGLVLKAPFDGVVSLGGPASGAGLGGLTSQLPSGLQSQAGGLSGLSGGGGAARSAASVAEGAPVASGDAVVTVTDVSTLSLTANVDENDVLQVHRGADATVQLDALPDATYTAKVTGIGVTPVQSSSGGGVSYEVTLSLGPGTTADGGPAPTPKPGMSATAGLRVREAHGALAVPSSAIVTSGQESTVWLAAPSGAVRRTVRLGAQGDTTVQILSGLEDGDHIVIKGADGVKAGQRLPQP